ncbi:MAG TPA: hypothetical protein VMJ34_08955 [Bryobacteraceae bacterium]|nr:hypothetical protein [Bryobacteraceae bacterium]
MLKLPALLLVCAALPTLAHNGPPFPIITDKVVGPVKISLWTHPDIGTGTFWVIVDPLPGQSIPGDLKIHVAVQPVNHRIPERIADAPRDDSTSQLQYIALIDFDRDEFVRARVIIQSARGTGDASATVEITPVAPKRWEMYLFLAPFLMVGFLWFRAVTTRRRKRKASHKHTIDQPVSAQRE